MYDYKLYRKQRANIIHWYIKATVALLKALKKANTTDDILDLAVDINDNTAQLIEDIQDL